nr:hypothetical protein [Tanacetum cinerariifolium]
LRKSNSLLNLVEMRLSQEREQKKVESQPTREKLKASNFHAIILQIGSWKLASMRGDDIQSFYTNWEDNGGFDHHGESMATYDQGSSYNGDFVSDFDQTSSNNLNLHLHAQGDSPLVMRFPYSNERTRRHVNENEERTHSHFEGISAITYGLQDHVPPCYGQESWIPLQQSQTKALHEEIQSTGYVNNVIVDIDQLQVNSAIGIQEPNSWQGVPDQYGHQWEQGVNHHYNTYWT